MRESRHRICRPLAGGHAQAGDKAAAKALAAEAGIPTVPGYNGAKQDQKALLKEAQRIGFPLLIKAIAGGGGRGLRVVDERGAFADALASAVREATSAFGDGRVLLEKLIQTPRHVEVQVFGDTHGNVVHLFERDCSLQRRHQKVIEEAPAPGMSAELRAALTEAAVTLAKAANYAGAGTVEFLVEGGDLGPHSPWYFIEMNTRLQVEHPVTEAITGIDLVEWQLRVASGEVLPLSQDGITMSGHAVEARLYAEDPARGFRPSVGNVIACDFASTRGVRVDTGVRRGDSITPFYDPMIAKLIAAGADRNEALDRLASSLGETRVAGPQTNIAFLAALVGDADVRAGRLDTGLIGRNLERLAATGIDEEALAAGAARLLQLRRERQVSQRGPWAADDAFQVGPQRILHLDVEADGIATPVTATWPNGSLHVTGLDPATLPSIHVFDGDDCVHVLARGRQTIVGWPRYKADDATADGAERTVAAPITGRIAKLYVGIGDAVAKGDRVAVVEAMKMEYVLHAGGNGCIAKLNAGVGAQVTQGAVIAEIVPDDAVGQTL